MDKITTSFLFLLFVFLSPIVYGANSSEDSGHKIDSIQRLINKSENDAVKSDLFFQLANYYLNINNGDSTLICFKTAYKLLPDTLGKKAEEVLNEIGLFYYRRSDFTQALSYFQKALSIATLNNDSAAIASRNSNIAVIYDFLGDYVKSVEHNQEALQIFEQQGYKKGMAFIYNNLGVLSEEMENPRDAIKYHRQALKLKMELDNKSGAGSTLNNIGVVYEQYVPNYDSSIFYYNKAFQVFTEAEDQSGIATALGNIGVIFWLKNQPDSAVFYAKKALEIRNLLKDDEGISSSLFNLGRAYTEMKNYQNAENYLKQSLLLSRKINSRKRTSEIYEALALMYNKKHEYNKAYNYQLQYSQLRDSILNEENNKQIAELKTHYELEEKDKKLNLLSHQNLLQKQSITRYDFLLAAIFLILLLISVISVLLVRHNRLKVRQQTTELQQKLLRSQMNPHFIFNTLFSIQTYMLENDAISASRFLSRFAKLMRHILENSKHEYVSLENEIEFLKNYLFIQQLRFDESFTYEVKYYGKEESSQIYVPPMLSQPFVENAIDHGIRDIQWKGRIEVSFTIKGKNLIVSIEDNGLGYKNKSGQKKILKNHQSTGIENTRQRIQLLTSKYKSDYLFEIKNLSQESSSRSGTMIIFAIPLIYS